ncbi:MAG: DUF4149 domain-containing protein [Pseudomonadota bacterium]
MMAARLRALLIALWAGSIWTVGYLVAPTLFATLADRVLAGTIAGGMFRTQAWLSVGCAIALLGLLYWRPAELAPRRRAVLMALAGGMFACTLLSHFALQPLMAQLREAAGPGGVMDGAAKSRFGLLHGVSSVIYLLQSVLAGVLVWKHR